MKITEIMAVCWLARFVAAFVPSRSGTTANVFATMEVNAATTSSNVRYAKMQNSFFAVLSMFSATISREVLDIGWLYQHNAAEVSVQPVEDSSPKIAQYKLLTTGRDKLADAAQIIISKGYKRVMIFCNTKYNTGMLANQLARLNFNVDCLHGDLSQAERNRIMTRFKAGEIDVLVATDVAARGIDVSDVDAVINYDVPDENEYYVHRVGRTGRAKRHGVAFSLVSSIAEGLRLDDIAKNTAQEIRAVRFNEKGDLVAQVKK